MWSYCYVKKKKATQRFFRHQPSPLDLNEHTQFDIKLLFSGLSFRVNCEVFHANIY